MFGWARSGRASWAKGDPERLKRAQEFQDSVDEVFSFRGNRRAAEDSPGAARISSTIARERVSWPALPNRRSSGSSQPRVIALQIQSDGAYRLFWAGTLIVSAQGRELFILDKIKRY